MKGRTGHRAGMEGNCVPEGNTLLLSTSIRGNREKLMHQRETSHYPPGWHPTQTHNNHDWLSNTVKRRTKCLLLHEQ